MCEVGDEEMIINKDVLKSLKPCEKRWKNFLQNYSDFNGSFDDFLDLELISYEDKIWVAGKILSINQLVCFSILCAESVLYTYEEKYPQDKRIHNLLTFMKSIVDFISTTEEQRKRLIELRGGVRAAPNAAYATAYAAYAADAVATCAVTCIATYAANAADYAAYAAYAVTYAAAARDNQQQLNLVFLKMAGSL